MDGEVYDLCIIGAGMFGSAAARHASANPKLKVCLVGPREPTAEESRQREIFSSHYDEGRIVEVMSSSYATTVLTNHTMSRFRELEKLSGIRFYTPVGYLLLADRENPEAIETLQALHSNNVPFVDLSDLETFKKRFPDFQLDENCDFRLCSDNGAGYIRARKIVEAEKKVAQLQGCRIINDVVEELKELKDGIHEIVTKENGLLRAERVLICTGAFTNYKKFHPLRRVRMEINKETVAMIMVSEDTARILSSMPVMNYLNNNDDQSLRICGSYILPPMMYPDGRYYLKTGKLGLSTYPTYPSLQEINEWYCGNGDLEVVNAVTNILRRILPNVHFEEISSKTCLTCHNSTGLPYIDRVTPTVSLAAVGNGSGAAMCDEVGRIASELSISGKWDSELPKSLFEAILEE